MSDIISAVYARHRDSVSFFADHNEISLKNNTELELGKVLVIYCASYFESEIYSLIGDYVSAKSGQCQTISSFVKRKALDRQYHTLFDWERANANRFFSFFGDESRARHESDVNRIEWLAAAESDFMFLGRARNLLVHSNFVTATIDVSHEDVYLKFTSAVRFLEYLRNDFFAEVP